IERVKKDLTDFSEKNNSTPDFSKLNLHADVTFTKIIPESLEYGSSILVTDDKKCAYNVGEWVKNTINSKIEKTREYTFNKNGTKNVSLCKATFIKKRTIQGKEREFTNSYTHLEN